ncbi:MAG: UvrD-helicase domain-containing protein, partial [Christensenellaceae bacterium]|nr:UvrD-helicase domain-containing protein [Christensenellaceae bacterium]
MKKQILADIKEREDIIRSQKPEILISANAGSGKTTAIIMRIVNQLLCGATRLNELLVLTFTNASAADMRTKLRDKLHDELQKNKAELWDGAVDDISSATIGTFHGFCAELLRSWFPVLGINPNFAVIDELDASKLKSDVFDSVIKNTKPDNAALTTFAKNRNFNKLREIVYSIHSFVTSRRDGADWFADTALLSYSKDMKTNLAFRFLIDYYKTKTNYLLQFLDKDKEPYIVFIANMINTICSYEDLHHLAVIQNFEKPNGKNATFPTIPKGKDLAYKQYRSQFKDMLNEIKKNFSKDEAAALAEIEDNALVVSGLVQITQNFIKCYDDKKREYNKLDFADLEIYALEILSNEDAAACIKSKYTSVFVDEGQDTNPIQYEIIERIVQGQASPKHDPNNAVLEGKSRATNFVMVGDPKQSIYGFRGCEPELFESRFINISDHSKVLNAQLNANFRSVNQILHFVNSIFEDKMQNYQELSSGKDDEFTDIEPVQVEIIVGGKNAGAKKDVAESHGVPIEDDIAEDDAVNAFESIKSIDAQFEEIYKHVIEIKKHQFYDAKMKTTRFFTDGDIAVLAESATHFNNLADYLSSRGIDVVIDRSIDVGELPEIAYLNSFLFAAANPENQLAVYITMKNPVFNFTEDEIVAAHHLAASEKQSNEKYEGFLRDMKRYSNLVRSLSAADLLTAFIVEKSYFSCLKPKQIQNVNRFIAKLSSLSFADSVVRYLYLVEHQLIDIKLDLSSNDEENSVKIMTIHGSKGLQFPAVIMFNLTDNWSTQGVKTQLSINKKMGLVLNSYDE